MKRCCTVLLASLIAATAGAATPIYRCGQTYTQTPCAGGQLIDSSDPRTAAQRAEARRAAQREKHRADEMERERLGQAGQAPAPTGFDARPVPAAAPASVPAKGRKKGARKAAAAASSPGVIFITPRPAK